MHDETQKTTDQNRAPNTSTPSVTTAPQTNPPARLDDMDKPSDASKTQDTGSEKTGVKSDKDARGTERSSDTQKSGTDTRSDKDRPNQKPIDPQGKPAPLTMKTPQTEGQDKNQPGKTQDGKPANATPNAV